MSRIVIRNVESLGTYRSYAIICYLLMMLHMNRSRVIETLQLGAILPISSALCTSLMFMPRTFRRLESLRKNDS
jgi:hypothetical protein